MGKYLNSKYFLILEAIVFTEFNNKLDFPNY